MYREIVKPTESTFIIHFPKSFLGQEIEVIAFPLENMGVNDVEPIKKGTKTLAEISAFYDQYKVDRGNFKFDRLEANNITDENWK